MSIEATSWALSVDTVPDSTARVILLGLANHAARDGSAAWPSVATLAEYAVCSERTVQRKLRELEARGLLRKGDQRLLQHLPADRRPVVYDLPIGVTICHPGPNGVTPVSERGDTTGTDGVTPVSPKPSMNHPEPSYPPKPPTGGESDGQGLLISPEPEAPSRAAVYPDAFEAVWAAWPKRRTDSAGKKAAHTAWARAVKGTAKRPARVTAEKVQAAVDAYAADPNLPPEQYQPNLTTWLNNDRWENGPAPARAPRSGQSQAGDTDAAMRRSFNAAQAYREIEEAEERGTAPFLLERKSA